MENKKKNKTKWRCHIKQITSISLSYDFGTLHLSPHENILTIALINIHYLYNNVIKQLLNEVQHDIENYQGRSLRYPPKPKAEVDNTNQDLDNSRYHAKTEFINCFIMLSRPKNKEQKSVI